MAARLRRKVPGTAVRPRREALRFAPLTPERWPDLVELFGPRGACGGCWCMWWRLPRSEFEAGKGAGNGRAFRKLVDSGRVPGILAYAGGEPVGWCAIEPRAAYPRLARSRNLKPVDESPVWSVTCFYVERTRRRRGLTVRLLEAAAKHARAQGARVIEGYPIEQGKGTVPAAFAWTGFVPAFLAAGFHEVARRSARQPILRRVVARR